MSKLLDQLDSSHWPGRFAPGEREAIETVCRYGHLYGFGNLISHLQAEWSSYLQSNEAIGPPLPPHSADMATGIICVWCNTDKRTGKKAKRQRRAHPLSPEPREA